MDYAWMLEVESGPLKVIRIDPDGHPDVMVEVPTASI